MRFGGTAQCSLRLLIRALVLVLWLGIVDVGVDAAVTSGRNPITSPLEGVYDADVAIPVTWKPTTSGTVSLILMKGSQDDLVEVAPLAATLANTGEYIWKVDHALEGQETMPANDVYGLMIKDDLTGLFEYSPPFRLRIPGSKFGKRDSTESTPASTSVSKGLTLETRKPDPTTSLEHEMENGVNLEAIFGTAGAGLGAIIIMIVGFSVWRRIQSEKKLAASRKDFRRRRDSLEDDDTPSPVTAQYAAHRRILSSSSFGDGARASDLFERSALEPPKPLSPIADSPPPTPFAAPPMVFPPSASLRRTSKGPAELHRRSSLLPPSAPGPTHQIAGFASTSPPEGFTLGPAPSSHNFSHRVPKYSAFNPDTPPTRPSSFAATETDTAIWDNHPT